MIPANTRTAPAPGARRAAAHAAARSGFTPWRTRAALALLLLSLSGPGFAGQREASLLLFSKTAGFRHASIAAGIAAVTDLGDDHGFAVDATEDAAAFTDENLARYDAVLFLSTTGDVLDDGQQASFERFIRAGGGYVGVHAAADTEYDWPWYGALVGAWFDGHPPVQEAALRVVDATHPATRSLPQPWIRTDEWYDYHSINPAIRVLIEIDESSYEGATTGPGHPFAWHHIHDGGRAFYTGGGHTDASWSEPTFLEHLAGGIMWVLDR
jgi:type 1 glutamine amidotransferase